MSDRRQPRVLGAQRTVSDALGEHNVNDKQLHVVIKRVVAGTVDESITLEQLERVVAYYANHNSEYTRPGEDDIQILIGEILNNSIRSVMIFGDFSQSFSDLEMYSISVAMQYNLSLEALTINGVNVSDETVSMICEALITSRVSFIDFSNTPLEDEAGRSLAALAHVNPYVRTIVLDDTLIAEAVLDEIDVACQFNQSNWEAESIEREGGVVGMGMAGVLGEAAAARRRHRLQHVIRARHAGTRFCAAHILGCCPAAAYCPDSHAPATAGAPDANANLHERLNDLFAPGGRWRERLPPPPRAGASWKDPDEQDEHPLRLNLERRRGANSQAGGHGMNKHGDGRWRAIAPSHLVGASLVLAFTVVCLAWWRR
ncbi:uncharacterized protein TM35_000331260 [Trypanosoma theileri]|uniref:C3H1-type domain-containing protein n=1 Tax=Trypanosoma theileri TaxID=67003 RepID=A0A1X0NNG2_9TRYP|nr:uncharacterized protein TM35_000331260 [Trypanosoma theileri]ORC85669.1 hypothetical protein TM35_000331260 [Trypanosoma theileri]